jgi:hypothetical protein
MTVSLPQPVTLTNNKEITSSQFKLNHKRREPGRFITLIEQNEKSGIKGKK